MRPDSSAAPADQVAETLGLDSLEAHFQGLVALPHPHSQALAALLPELERAAASAAAVTGRPHALRGRVLALLGKSAEGLAALERSLALDPDHARTLCWKAAALAPEQRFGEALDALDRAVGLDPGFAWSHFHRAVCRFSLGQPQAARDDLNRLLAAAPEGSPPWLAGQAFLGLAEAGEGRPEAALAALDRVVGGLPTSAWPLVLRARVFKGMGDFPACQRDLDAAVAFGEAGWILLERSRLFEELGNIGLALEDVERVLRLEGPGAGLLLRRAHLQVCRRHHHLAVEDLTRALELEVRPELYRERARVHTIMGRLDSARKDSLRALRLAPGDRDLRLEHLHQSLLARADPEVLRGLDALLKEAPGLGPRIAFEKGCFFFKLRDFRRAARAFAGGSDLRAGYYRCLAEALARTPARRSRGVRPRRTAPGSRKRSAGEDAALGAQLSGAAPGINICGLGHRPPFTMTVDVARAVLECDVVFNNLNEPEIADLLHLLAPACRPTAYDIQGGGREWTRVLFREVGPGRTVGFVTRGHPLVCGGLAFDLIKECKATGVGYRVCNAVSSMDTVWMRGWAGRDGSCSGQQVLDYSSLAEDTFAIDTRLPATMYFNASIFEIPQKAYLRICEVLEKTYAADHVCLFYGRRFDVEPARIRVGELRGRFGKIDPSFTLVLPPKP